MSLDVDLIGPKKSVLCRCSECQHEHTREESEAYFSANITHNLNSMADAAGIYKALWRPEEIGISRASELIPLLAEGLKKLRNAPIKFKKLNPPNGWGDYDGLVEFVSDYLAACIKYPDATVQADR